ncbi:hypothetical protein BBL81_02390 [Vibrio parahaemolyticus]|uniref:hypothetical protein n=1 Tax=Vibrio parahaemolyticus TaxID=670 RepID=UPI00084B7635|nr:hypothetical protein [Vibrio parahaemolyticus]ODW29626.1 hypothetical protein BBL81_02390 [Vibrio parahaemolyticus]
MKEILKFISLFTLPMVVVGSFIGTVSGFVAKWLTLFFEVFDKPSQYEYTFWSFVIIGFAMGLIGGGQALLLFIKEERRKAKSTQQKP